MEDNIKIAQFIGAKYLPETERYGFRDAVAGKYWHKAEDLQFDTNWNWLMPVVEKMWSISRHRHLFYQEIRCNNGDDVMDQKKITIFPTASPDNTTAIEEVYSLVLNFIDYTKSGKSCV